MSQGGKVHRRMQARRRSSDPLFMRAKQSNQTPTRIKGPLFIRRCEAMGVIGWLVCFWGLGCSAGVSVCLVCVFGGCSWVALWHMFGSGI